MRFSNPCFRILEENCANHKERQELYEVLENNAEAVGSRMISNLYGSTLMKSDIDFDDIPFSNGDIEQCRCYPIMASSLSILSSLSNQMKIKIPEILIVETSISYIKKYKSTFQKAFKMRCSALIMHYNTLVYACVEATSMLLAWYVDYIKTPGKIKLIVKKESGRQWWDQVMCMQTLESFNKSCKDGSFNTLCKQLLSGKVSRAYESTTVVAEVSAAAIGMGITVAMSIIPLLRTIIYYFYYSRMKIANFLEQQVQFLQMNEANINSSIDDPTKRKDVLDRQKKLIKRFEELSDKIKINDKVTTNKVNKEMKNENKKWTLDSIKSSDDFGML